MSDSIPLPGDHDPIVGLRLTFRPIAEVDLPDLMRWLADSEVVAFYGDPPASIEATREDYLEPGVNPTWRFVIEDGGRGVGEIQYHHAYVGEDYTWKAGIDIFIGEPDARDHGVGTEAIRTMLGYLFETKQVHLVTIDPEVKNGRGIRAYEKAGFHLDGVLRHDMFVHDEYVDTHLMSILEDEWPAAKARWQAEVAARAAGGS